MSDAYARVGEHTAESVTVHVPQVGPWVADVVFDGAPDVSGRVSIWLGELELVGTIDAEHDGVAHQQRRSRIRGGGGGWSSVVTARAYHNDARIRARTIVEDAAREVGETLGDFAPTEERIGIDYVREAGPAARVLEDVIGDAGWWVDYTGRTHVGSRAAAEATGYQILEYDPSDRIATLAVDELSTVHVGDTIDGEQLDAPLAIRELTITVREESVRVRAWLGGTATSQSRLVDALRTIIDRAMDGRLFGHYRYRVVRMSGDRVELQAVRRRAGLPDVLPVSMWPGVAGVHAALTPGAECLVVFIEGRRAEPIVTHFAGKDGSGWSPANLTLDATSEIKLGNTATNYVALANLVNQELDNIQATLDAFIPGSGGAEFPTPYIAGNVAATKVKAL
jgi:hypothetical protein